MKKRLLTLILAVILCISSFTVYAAPNESSSGEKITGTHGDNVTWSLENGTLTISGEGRMQNQYYPYPWSVYGTAIENIVVEEGITSISDEAFKFLISAASVTLPESLEIIGSYAFNNCYSLTEINIPKFVHEIGYNPFQYCRSLTAVNVDPKNNTYRSVDGVLFTKSLSHLIKFPANKQIGTYYLPNEVVYITYASFDSCTGVKNIICNDTLVKIEFESFFGSNIESIGIHADYEQIDQTAFERSKIKDIYFYDCTEERAVEIKESVKELVLPSDTELNFLSSSDFQFLSSFEDVLLDAWYNDSVKYVKDNNLMTGTGENSFSPEMTSTRAMFVTVLYRMEGEPEYERNCTFTDIPENSWFTDAVYWAAANNITTGTGNNEFSPNVNISAEQLVTFLYRFAKSKGYEGKDPMPLEGYKYAAWAAESVEWANANGMIDGILAHGYMPSEEIDRAGMADILAKFCAFENNAENGVGTEWKFLFVVFGNVALNTVNSVSGDKFDIQHKLTDEEFEDTKKVAAEFEKDMTEFSGYQVNAKAEVVKIDALFDDFTEGGYNDYSISEASALKYLNDNGVIIDNYDHVFFSVVLPDLPRTYYGLGGTCIKDDIAMSQIVMVPSEQLNGDWPAGVYIHEFLHSIEYAYGTPTPDGSEMYGYGTSSDDGWRTFYSDIMTKRILYNGIYIGISPYIWKNPPRLS